MLKKFLWIMTAACLVACPGLAGAGEVDILVQKLVDKGVLTPYEAQIVLDDTKQEVAKQNAKGANESLPSWIQTIKLKGDLRLRYENIGQKAFTTASTDERTMGRYRMRLGFDTKVNDKVNVGVGFASGAASKPRSTNQSFDENFSKASAFIDYAFAEYLVNSKVRAIGGKYAAGGKGYLWNPTDLLWDTDITQEGASVHAEMASVLNGDVFANAGAWVVDEDGTSTQQDPFMYYAQAGIGFNPEPVDFKVAGTYYGFEGIEKGLAEALNDSGSSNTRTGNNNFYKMDSYGVSLELGLTMPEGAIVPRVALFGDYINNPNPSKDNTGYSAGLMFGHKSIKTAGNWLAKYLYVHLEKDAWLDIFPDSDRRGGKTNTKGHEWILEFGLAKNISLALDYYRSENIKVFSESGNAKQREDVFQADLNFKF